MLSTKPFTGAPASHSPGGAGAGARAQGAPEARAMSGQPRPDQGMRPGTYQIMLTYNNLTIQGGGASDPQPPVGETVTLVGYRSDDTVEVRTQKIDATGRTIFEELDISGHTTYFAMARLPRGGGLDRLMAVPVQPDTQVGAKVILSGDKRDATAPPIDELTTAQSIPTSAGKVRVTLEGIPAEATIKLVDAATKTVLGEAPATSGTPDPRRMTTDGAPFQPSADLPPGTVAIRVHGGPMGTDVALPDVPIRVIPADQDQAEGVSSKTGPDGTVQMQVPSDKPQRAVLTVNGKDLVSDPFEVARSGGKLDVGVSWEAKGRPQAVFDVAYRPELVVYAEARFTIPGPTAREELFRSRPAQLLPSTGTHLPVTIYPRVLINFSKRAAVEDEMLGVRGTYMVENVSWAPYSAGPDGMVIPLPKGFRGGKIAEEHQSIASIAPGEGIRLVRPLPPGRTKFIVGYTLVSAGGELDWKLDIKQDMFQSGMEIRLHGDMTVMPQGRTRGRYFVEASFAPGQLPPGTAVIRVHDGTRGRPDVALRVLSAERPDAQGIFAKTGPDGSAQVQVPAGKQVVVLSVDGKDLESNPFDVTSTGGLVEIDLRAQWFVLDDISIRAGQGMEMKLTNMPAPPEWRVWVPRLVGLLVIGMMVAGVVYALTRKRSATAPGGDKRRQALLDELVELERAGGDPARREQVVAELERLWRE
jgi:hypothetical protein